MHHLVAVDRSVGRGVRRCDGSQGHEGEPKAKSTHLSRSTAQKLP